MKKIYKIYEMYSDGLYPSTTILKEFLSESSAINYMNDNAHKFDEEIEYMILPSFVKEDNIVDSKPLKFAKDEYSE